MKDLISLLVSMAMADGRYHQAEERLIRSIAARWGSASATTKKRWPCSIPRASLDTSYTILGVHRDVRTTEVKNAYRRLAKEYHPDVVANKGMGEDFQKFAAEKMRAINSAYDAIKEARGF